MVRRLDHPGDAEEAAAGEDHVAVHGPGARGRPSGRPPTSAHSALNGARRFATALIAGRDDRDDDDGGRGSRRAASGPAAHMPTQTRGSVTPAADEQPAGSSRPRRYPGDGRTQTGQRQHDRVLEDAGEERPARPSVLNTPPSMPPTDIHT